MEWVRERLRRAYNVKEWGATVLMGVVNKKCEAKIL
jgi:hypothetical protein